MRKIRAAPGKSIPVAGATWMRRSAVRAWPRDRALTGAWFAALTWAWTAASSPGWFPLTVITYPASASCSSLAVACWVCSASRVNTMRDGSCPAVRRSSRSVVTMGISLVLPGISRWARTTGVWWVAADSRCGAARSPTRAPRTALPSIATARRGPSFSALTSLAVQAASTASNASLSIRVAIRRSVASLGATTAPVSGSGAAPSVSSRRAEAAAAHCAEAAKDPSPAQVNDITSTPSTYAIGWRRPPSRRGSGTERSARSRSPACSADTSLERVGVREDGYTGAAPADDAWLRHRHHRWSRVRPPEYHQTRSACNSPVTPDMPPHIADVTGPWVAVGDLVDHGVLVEQVHHAELPSPSGRGQVSVLQ